MSIIQSNYIPWKGYFDIIGLSDEFLILDSVQFTKNDWRNRNRIKVAQGQPWLTIPVRTGGRFGQAIEDVEVDDPRWTERHWSKLEATYRHLPGFHLHGPAIFSAYKLAASETRLSGVNRIFIDAICKALDIRTRISVAPWVGPVERTDRLIAICAAAGADRYISGPAAKDYLDEALLAREGIELDYMDYGGYPIYDQVNPPFEHGVSILDLLFCAGEKAASFMKFYSYRESHPWDRTEPPTVSHE